MELIVRRIWNSIKNNKKIIENYFFMTLILILNSLFALLIYPYLIRALGKESYGIYIFGTSIANYFICFIGFSTHFTRKSKGLLDLFFYNIS